MLFNIEHDFGDVIEGYLIPDGYSEEPSILVKLDDGSSFTMRCDQLRQAAKDSGRHLTGLIGFRLDETTIPDLAQQKGLSIRDADSGLLIYRRVAGRKIVDLKMCHLELRMIPTIKFDKHCGRYFQYAMATTERFGNETVLQMFHLNAVNSIYIGGRLRLRAFEEFLEKDFNFVCTVPEPYYEMASRLFILKRLSREPVTFISERDHIFMQPAAQHFAEVNLDDEAQIKRALKRANEKVRNVIVSPVTRQLMCRDADQQVTRGDIAGALDLASRFATVGYDNDIGHFHDTVADMLDISSAELPVSPRYSYLEELADKLRHMRIAETMLEEDLIFDYYIKKAIQAGKETIAETSL